MLRRCALSALLFWSLSAHAAEQPAAPGSWEGRAPAFQVARSDLRSCSAALRPPALARGRQLAGIAWQFAAPAGAPLRAWLCHPQRCTALPGARGRSRALAGLDAGAPLQLCFRLEEGARPLRVGGLQVLAEYR
ncbi:flagellar protein FlhE [Pseudomonas stutzeri]|nr:flagellar protein FlhE [Stutzerimonas stutzeri]